MSDAADYEAERRCLAGLSVAACALDHEFRIRFRNAAATDFFRQPHSSNERPLLDHIHPADRRAIKAELESAWTDLGAATFSCRAGCDETWSQIDLHLGPSTERGLRLVVLIPKRLSAPASRPTSAASRRSSSSSASDDQAEEWRRFAYTVAHDLKVPLVTMEGNLRLMQQDLKAGQTERLSEDLAAVDEAVQKMKRLVIELLDLARIGRLDLVAAARLQAKNTVDLNQLVDEVTREVVSGRPTWKGLIRRVDELPTVFGHAIQLTEVFQNLIDNAVKYTGTVDAPRVEISRRTDEGGTTVTVSDNGCGIHRQDRNRVFDLFVQLRADAPGVGIGLSIVRSIVNSHGGRVWIEDGLECRGVSICVFLPLSESLP